VRKFLSRLNSKEVLLRAKSLFTYVDAHRQQFVGFEEFEQLYNNAIYVKLVSGAVGSAWGKVRRGWGCVCGLVLIQRKVQ